MIAVRDHLTRNRTRLTLAAVLGTLSLAIAVEHSGVGHGELMADAMDDAVSMCLAVVDAVGAVLLGAFAVAAAIRRRQRPVVRLLPTAPNRRLQQRLLAPAARAGPSLLAVFRR